MTCDDVLPALEFGDAPQRQAARDHARHCPACAAAVERWLTIKSALGSTPALTDRERAAWRDARRAAPDRPRFPRGAWLAGVAAVAACVAAALLWPTPVERPAVVLPHSPERVADEYDALDRRLDEFDAELAALPNRIALADARRTAAELTAEYRR